MRSLTLLFTFAAAGCAIDSAPSEGRWLTRGYGSLLELEGHELRIHEIRRIGTLPITTAHRMAADPHRFLSTDYGIVTLENRDGEFVLNADGLNHPIVLDATTARSKPLPESMHDDPQLNFEWFAATFREHYAFFERRGVDWERTVIEARARVSRDTSREDLLAIFGEMIEPLHDGHVWVDADHDSVESERPDPDEEASDRFGAFQRVALEYGEDANPVRACGGRLLAAKLDDGVGYLRLDGMHGDTDQLERGLDRAFDHLNGMRGLVIDVRFNGGGDDTYGFRLASRLTQEPFVAATKSVRCDPDDPQRLHHVGDFVVEPSTRPGFDGPVVLLVSRYTASAAEVFGMAMLARDPPAWVVGEQSESIFSDVFSSELPNGWTVALSNEVYRMADGRCFEAVGLPLDVELPTLRCGHIETREDPALESAMEYLAR